MILGICANVHSLKRVCKGFVFPKSFCSFVLDPLLPCLSSACMHPCNKAILTAFQHLFELSKAMLWLNKKALLPSIHWSTYAVLRYCQEELRME